MIPILFEEGTTDFSNNGIGRLSACISCKVEEKESGVYECTFKYPMTGIHYSDIQEKRIIYTIHDDTKTKQPFEIYGRSAPHNGVVTFYAHHVSYLLGNVVLNPFTATSALETMTRLKQYEINTSPFTFWTDKQVVADFEIKVPTVTRSILAGVEGSILDVYGGGDYEWDGYVVKLWADRGQDNNVNIRYGVNLLSMRQDTDDSSTFNAVCPFWRHEGTGEDDPDILVTLPEKIIRASSATSQTLRPVTLDLSDKWDTAPDVQQLRDYSVAYMNQNLSWRMDESVEVDFVALWQTEDYKNVAPLQRVRIYDYVHIIYDELGINKKLQVVEVEYNVLTERYDRMILGAAKPSFAEVVSGVVENNLGTNLASKSFVQQAVSLASETIKGMRGGYKLEITDADGHTMETLYMDAPNVEDAVNILRIGMSGIAFSNHGYDPEEFVSAWDINGNFNANFIKTGILDANLIKAGIISDLAGKNFWNLETGEFSLQVVEGDSIDTAIKNAASSVAGYTLETPFTWSNNRQTANFTAIVYRGRTDVTAEFPDSWFVWTLRTEDGESQIGTGKTLSVNKSLFGYGATITCTFTTYEKAALRSVAGKKLKSVSGKQMLMYAEQDTDIVVSDLPVKTATQIALSDTLMGIDHVEGYQISIQDFANGLATNVYDAKYASISNVYTKAESDARYADISNVYTKAESDSRYVNVDGDTMTGTLTISVNNGQSYRTKYNSIDARIGQTAPSSNIYWDKSWVLDKNNRLMHYEEGAWNTDNNFSLSYGLRRHSADGNTQYTNYFSLNIDNSGTGSIFVSHPAAWRNAINALNKSGDTMTGNLTMSNNSYVYFSSDNINATLGTTRSNNQYWGGIYAHDKNATRNFYSEMAADAQGGIYRSYVIVAKNSSGTQYYNGFYLNIDKNGTPSVSFSNNEVRDAWRNAINAVSKSGDTLSGSYTINGAVIVTGGYSFQARGDWTVGTTPSSSIYSPGYYVSDKNSTNVGYMRGYYGSDGALGLQFEVQRTISSTRYALSYYIWITDDGTPRFYTGNPAAFRSGLDVYSKSECNNNYVNVSGDTMSGALTVSKTGIGVIVSNSTNNDTNIEVKTNHGRLELDISGAGRKGIWTDEGWVLWRDTNDHIYLNGHDLTTGVKPWTLIAETSGTTAKSYSSIAGYTEACIMAWCGTSYISYVTIPLNSLSLTTEWEIYLGGGRSGTSASSMTGRRACCKFSGTKLTPYKINMDGVEKDGSWRLYVR